MYLGFWKKRSHRSLWQHPNWATFQEAVGNKTWMIETDDASALLIKRKLPGGFSWLEIPRGPLWSENAKSLPELKKKIEAIGKKERSIFVRMSSYGDLTALSSQLKATKYDHHPETSLTINLQQSEDDILKQMKPKGRYNIKVAQKHGVQIATMNNVDDYYELMTRTGNRDGFGIHPKSYYQKMIDSMPKNAQLLLAVHDHKAIAGGIFVYLDDWGIYYYGASDNDKRNLMAPYLLQWEAMKEAKKRGCKYYDFLGIAPEGAKNHAWAGVTQFKKKFGGKVVSYPQAKDMVLKPLWYAIYRFYKRIR